MARRVTVELPPASGELVSTAGCLLLHATRETTGVAAAVYRFFDGSGTGGLMILPVSLAAGESTRDNFWRCVLPFRQGLFYQLVSGTVEGNVTVLLDHECHEYWARLERALGLAG